MRITRGLLLAVVKVTAMEISGAETRSDHTGQQKFSDLHTSGWAESHFLEYQGGSGLKEKYLQAVLCIGRQTGHKQGQDKRPQRDNEAGTTRGGSADPPRSAAHLYTMDSHRLQDGCNKLHTVHY